jgi:hypothetical protein
VFVILLQNKTLRKYFTYRGLCFSSASLSNMKNSGGASQEHCYEAQSRKALSEVEWLPLLDEFRNWLCTEEAENLFNNPLLAVYGGDY